LEEELLEQLKQAIIAGDDETATRIAKRILEAGLDPVTVIEQNLAPAMKIVGDKFENQEYFLADLMNAGEAMKAASKILTSNMDRETMRRLEQERSGVVVMGTIKGDQHDIGKNLVALLLQANRFDVHDLGVDVGPREFFDKSKEVDADIIGLSALLTTTMPYQAEVINYLRDSGVRDQYKVIVGGGATSQDWANEIGAEGWAPDATRAVQLANRVMETN
jgi:trimethylamine corrinoid protein